MKTQREKQGWSQAALAEKLEASTGLSLHQQTLHKIESDARSIKLEEAAAIARCLGLSFDDMTSGLMESALVDSMAKVADRAQEFESALRRMWEAQLAHAILDDAYRAAGVAPQWLGPVAYVDYPVPGGLGALEDWKTLGGLKAALVRVNEQRAVMPEEVLPHIASEDSIRFGPDPSVAHFYRSHPYLAEIDGIGGLLASAP
ncbi:hypothetical protein BG28_06665 [Nesterenkonia sp. AN1]|nr:hypothetical protein BG28_06665 [Nesterenkonia sp. AN1]